jgi:hypothetical protein
MQGRQIPHFLPEVGDLAVILKKFIFQPFLVQSSILVSIGFSLIPDP